MDNTIGEALKKVREDLSYRKFAEKADLSYSLLFAIEKRGVVPSCMVLKNIINVLPESDRISFLKQIGFKL